MEAGPSRPRPSRPSEGSAHADRGPSSSATKGKTRRKARLVAKKTASKLDVPSNTPSSTPRANQPKKKKRKTQLPESSASSPGDVVFLEERSKPHTLPHRLPPKPSHHASPHSTAEMSSPMVMPPPISPQSTGKKGKSRKRRKQDRAQRISEADDELMEMDEINGSFLDLEVDISGDGPEAVDALLASTNGRKGKRKSTNESPVGEGGVPGAKDRSEVATPSAYKPMRRSIIAGLRLSPDPPSQASTPPQMSFVEGAETTISSTHFDPPPVFTATLPATTDTAPPGEKPVDQAPVGDLTNGLLLPAHIILDGMDDVELTESGEGVGDDEGLFFLDEDTTKNVQRYFDPSLPSTDSDPTFLNTADQSRICRKCKRPGHRSEQCPHLVCDLCGAMDDHEKGQCKFGVKCFKCGQRGHRREDCKNAAMSGCNRCGSHRHIEFACPSHWRIYSYLSIEARGWALGKKEDLRGWEKEAAGGAEWEAWCYNCAREGHFGDDCNMRRGSLVPLDNPSPFSDHIASRGPFAQPNGMRGRNGYGPNPSGGGNHMRFEDNLPDLQPAFAGLGAGQKGKAKSLAAQRQAERVAGMMENEDDPVWVSGGSSLPPAPHSGDKATPIRHGLPPRPFDSERRDRTPQSGGRGAMPFSHGHLMSAGPPRRGSETHWTPHSNGQAGRGGHLGKGISFGRISMPGAALPPHTDTSTPTYRAGASGRGRGGAAAALVARALGGGNGTPSRTNSNSPSSSRGVSPLANGTAGAERRKRKSGEMDAWANGNLGGNVAGWGKEMDTVERAAKAPKRNPGSPAGLKIKGASAVPMSASGKSPKKGKGSVATAQKYYGGY